jgi:hypothetical protein
VSARGSRPARNRWRAGARSGFLYAAGAVARPAPHSFVRCLYFHYVYDDQVEAFRTLVSRLQRIGTFVSAERVRRSLNAEQPIDDRLFHLSIDDGLDNVHRNAFPVSCARRPGDDLRAHRVRRCERRAHAGFEIGAHTRHHVRLSEISHDVRRLDDEIRGAKHDVEAATTSSPTGRGSTSDTSRSGVASRASRGQVVAARRSSVAAAGSPLARHGDTGQ